MKEVEKYNRKSLFVEDDSILSNKGDFIEVCEWHNMEGFDATITNYNFSMTYDQFKILKKLIKQLKSEQ